MITKGKYPAIPYQKALLQFAMAKGMRMWTIEDRIRVVTAYELFIAKLN